jgi:hypothetical protein
VAGYAAHGRILQAFLLVAPRLAEAVVLAQTPVPGAGIPELLVQQVLNPEGLLLGLASAANASAANASANGQLQSVSSAPAYESTAAMDLRQCPTVMLPSFVALRPTVGVSSGLSGVWTDRGMAMASFGENFFFPQSWDYVYIRDIDHRLALRAEIKNDQQIDYLYGWRSQNGPMDYPNISRLEEIWAAASWHALNEEVTAPRPPTSITLADCRGRLIFVVRLHWTRNVTLHPGSIDIYDRFGNLTAHALVDRNIARYQFVDPLGRLLAVAESPGLYQNISLADMPRDPDKGYVLPFELRFEGGYANSSRLIDPEWRWIIAAAMQLRAIQDAHSQRTPRMPAVMVAIYWVCFAFGLLVLCCTGGVLHRTVYSRSDSPDHVGVKSAGLPYIAAKAV